MQRLKKMYGNPPIACHHDYAKCSLEGVDFPKDIEFLYPSLEPKWGGISLCHAFLALLRQMYNRTDSPEWFFFLSGTDYPVKPARALLDQLDRGGFDAYLDHRLVEYPWTPDPSVQYEAHAFKSAAWVPLAYDRWVALRPWLPWYSWTRRKPVKIPLGTIRSKLLVSPFNPFSATLKCYGGSGWFTCNRKAAERLLAQTAENRALIAHYSHRFIPDESLPHTILCNQPDLKIANDGLRYIDWSQGGHHPKNLGIEDLCRILDSQAPFARKFDLATDPEVLDALDSAVDAASL
ncbi:MAG: beta-1,6-N-acetylglucosaminyltransferase [Terracidiphilus sp.]